MDIPPDPNYRTPPRWLNVKARLDLVSGIDPVAFEWEEGFTLAFGRAANIADKTGFREDHRSSRIAIDAFAQASGRYRTWVNRTEIVTAQVAIATHAAAFAGDRLLFVGVVQELGDARWRNTLPYRLAPATLKLRAGPILTPR